MSASLEGVEQELAARITGAQNELAQRGIVTIITTGHRSLPEAQRLWDEMVAAQKKWGKKWQRHAALAAYPGTSDHCKDPSRAVDLALTNPSKQNLKAYKEVCVKWGLFPSVKTEYWHQILDAKRGPMPGISKEQAMSLVIEPVGAVERPQRDGGWAFGAHGHVYAYGSANYWGGWDDATRNDPKRCCVALVASPSGEGYWLVSNYGETYAYNAQGIGNYQGSWGAGVIIGAYGNTKGGVTLLRDDGVNLNTYALPV